MCSRTKRRRFETLAAAVRHYDAAARAGGDAAGVGSAGRRRWRRRRGICCCSGGRGWSGCRRALEALSPVAILERGYALVFDASGNLVKDAGRVKAGDRVEARLARGRVRARVEGTEE